MFAAASSEPRVQFTNIAREAGITFKHENGASKEKLMPETFGSGVAVIDLSTSDMRLYVGLGKNTVVQRLAIEWPRGKKQVLENVSADQLLTLDEVNAR